jgi:pyruvate, water dikinase
MTSREHDKVKAESVDRLMQELEERAKELNCLYQIEDALSTHDAALEDICPRILEAIPPGWQYPDVCEARIRLGEQTFATPGLVETEWVQRAEIMASGIAAGTIEVYYTQEMPAWDDGPFLKEEAKLIQTIADRIGHRIMHQRMRSIAEDLKERRLENENGEWRIVLQMLKQTDRNLYLSVSRKMLNHLCWSGVKEADELMKTFTPDTRELETSELEDGNQPWHPTKAGFSFELSDSVFKMAREHLNDDETFRLLQKWIQEDKLSFLVQVVNRNLSLSDVADAIRRYHHLAENEPEIQSPNKRGIEVSLIRRFLSDHLQYLNVAKNYIEVHDFYHLLNRVIYSSESHGKLGGKSAGLYLAAQILKKKSKENELLGKVRIPKTYHITSDVLLHFMHYNNFDEVVEQKYKPISQVRFEYPHVLQTFTSSRFPSEIVNGLSVALDDFNERPLIVRSSSLLEDRIGAAFSGKYKSLFLANQGSKQKRLKALMEAVAEVYASTFSPDPIEYRASRFR